MNFLGRLMIFHRFFGQGREITLFVNESRDLNNVFTHEESALDDLNNESGLISFGFVDLLMLMGARDTRLHTPGPAMYPRHWMTETFSIAFKDQMTVSRMPRRTL
jgi:hypothetical protein